MTRNKMKYLLIGLLFIGSYCKAQKLTDSAYAVIEGVLKNRDTSINSVGKIKIANFDITNNIPNNLNITPLYDTIPVIMLVSDTSCNNCYIGMAFYVLGYSVGYWKNGKYIDAETMCLSCPDYRVHETYLDDKKKKLNPSLVIWQSKEIKQ